MGTDDAGTLPQGAHDFGLLPTPLTVIGSVVEERDLEAVDFLAMSSLPLSSVVLALFGQSDDCIKLIDPAGKLQFMNCNGQQVMEIDDFSVIAGCHWSAMWPAENSKLVNEAIDAALAGQTTRFEAPCPTAKGTPKWWEVTVSPILGNNGQLAAILSTSRDITDRKQQTEQLSAMAFEMRHRLRNAYAISAALVRTTGRDDPHTRAFSLEMADRYMQLAEVQSDLLEEGGVCLQTAVNRIIKAFGAGSDIEIGDVPKFELNERQARAIVVVLSEMATNSVKYGALSGRGALSISAAVAGGQLVISWHEVLREPPSERALPVRGGGSGRVLKERMLATVGGAIAFDQTPEHFAAKITIPV